MMWDADLDQANRETWGRLNLEEYDRIGNAMRGYEDATEDE